MSPDGAAGSAHDTTSRPRPERRPGRLRPCAADDGSVLWLALPAMALLALCALLVVDLTAYLVAAGRAQAAADSAALAAVAAGDPRTGAPGSPRSVAARTARAGGATLRSCDCAAAARSVVVVVAVDVRAIAVTRFAPRTVEARARASLVPDGAGSGSAGRARLGRLAGAVRRDGYDGTDAGGASLYPTGAATTAPVYRRVATRPREGM